MKQIHIKYVLLAITLASLITPGYAQYTGGNGKGDQQLAFSDITLNGTLLADLTSYTGGSGKGDAWIIAEDVNLSGVALSGLVYTGGSGRGDALATSNDNIPLGKYFVGTTADFTLGSNWNDGAFPSSEVAIVNSLASNQPVLSGSQTIASGTTINILSGASLTIAPTGVLTVNGTLNNSGTLTLQSNATGSASIGNSSGSVTGNVTVERFIPSNGRRWRYLSAPFASGPTIASSWQQQIHITGSGTGGTVCPTLTPHTNGFDATTLNNPGMMTFNETVATAPSFTNGYTAVSNTNATNLSAGNGYIVFIRGARSQGCSLLDGTNPTPDAVTLSASGSIVNSSYNYSGLTYTSTNGEGWNLLGNPFPSNINWDASGWTKTNIDNTVYQYIPGTNSYTSWNGAAGTGGVTDGIIPSGGAFFVKANAASPALSVTQADKTQVNPGAGLFKSLKLSAGIRLKLQNQTGLSDESVITLQNNYTDSYNGNAFDAEKLLNPNGFNIYSILRNGSGKQLVFNGLAPVDVNTGKIIPIGITTPAIGSYQLQINLSEMPYHYEVYLIDSFLSTTTLLTENNSYPFTVTASAQSTGNNRFSIAVQNKLPISTGVNGSALNKTRIQVFPNPANNWLTIGVNNTVKEETTVNVTDMFGKQIMQLTFIGQNHTIDISALAAGAYFVEVQNGNTKNIFKTIKQ